MPAIYNVHALYSAVEHGVHYSQTSNQISLNIPHCLLQFDLYEEGLGDGSKPQEHEKKPAFSLPRDLDYPHPPLYSFYFFFKFI